MRRHGLPSVLASVQPGAVFSATDCIPKAFYGRGRWHNGAMHTFVDDWRQEFFWRRPEEGLLVALAAGVVTAPDYTVWTDDPPEWRVYQSWRSMVIAGYWQAHGVRVIPVVSFGSGVEAYSPRGGTWAIRGPRLGCEESWLCNLAAFVSRAAVGRLVVFGRRAGGVGLGRAVGCDVEFRALQPGRGSRGRT